MRTINLAKYLRLFQIEPVKTVEFRFIQIGKKGAKMLHTVCQRRKKIEQHPKGGKLLK